MRILLKIKKAPRSAHFPHSATIPGNPPPNQCDQKARPSIDLKGETTAGHREEAGAWQPDATDFPIECKRDIVAGDIVHFTAQADALPGSLDGEDAREVQVVALIVDRTAGKWEDEDLCTLETLWRSDDGPGGTFAEQLDLLTVGDCARMMREQEEERVSAEVELEEARAVVWEIHLSMSMTM